MPRSGIRDGEIDEAQELELRQRCQALEPGIGKFRAVENELLQLVHPRDLLHGHVTDTRMAEPESFQMGHVDGRLEPAVGDVCAV